MMKTIEFEKFKKNWTNRIESIFWDKLRKKEANLFLTYMFDFCTLNSEVKSDQNGQLYICYNYEEINKSESNLLIQNIFSKLFSDNHNENYIGYYRLNKNDDFREILIALFILGNEIDDVNLKKYLLKDNILRIYKNFEATGLDTDQLLDIYMNEIIEEFEIVSLRTKDEIFKNDKLLKNSEKFWDFPFVYHN